MIHQRLLMFLTLYFVFNSVFGQSADTLSLTLKKAWELSFKNYPTLQIKTAERDQAVINEKLVGRSYLPELQIQAQNTVGSAQGNAGSFFPLPGIFNVNGNGFTNVGTNFNGSVLANWDFFQFGRHRASVEASSFLTKASLFSIDEESNELMFAISSEYLNVLHDQEMVKWAIGNHQRLNKLLNVSKSLSNAGLKPGADTLLIQASLFEAKSVLDGRRANLDQSRLMLAKLTGMVNSTSLAGSFYTISEKNIREEIKENHPLLSMERAEMDYARSLKKLTGRSFFPTVSFLGGYSYRGNANYSNTEPVNSLGNSFNGLAGNYLLGIGITWTVSDLYNLNLEKSRSRALIKQREAEYKTAYVNLDADLKSSQNQLESNLEQIRNSESAYQAAQKAFDLFQARYNEGLINLTELLQLQLILQQTEKSRIDAYKQYWDNITLKSKALADYSILEGKF